MSYKILLADDSVTVQKIITLTFSDEGVDVVTVNNGDEAINRLQHMRPALVMADVSIPGRNGYDICEFVKRHPEMKETPVILLVPAFEPFDEERARRIGADYHLTKPFQSIRTLISTVKHLIEREAAPEFSVAGSGLTIIQRSEPGRLEAAEVDPKKARIDKLIKLSSQTSPENAPERAAEDEVLSDDEILSEVDLTRSESEQANALAIAEISDELEISETSRESVIEDYPAQALNGPVAANFHDSIRELDEDLDNVLELDDLFPEAIAVPAPRIQTVEVPAGDEAEVARPAERPEQKLAEKLEEKPEEKNETVNIPPSVIDEIVDRVVAQLSEKLSRELARRIAPEVAELVKQQQLAGSFAYRDADNLLDLD